RLALRWSLTTDEPDVGLRILASIWRFWQRRSEVAEGAAWASELLAHPRSREDTRVRIGALSAAGGIAYWANDFETVRSAYTERLALAETIGDDLLLAEAHYEMGFLGVIDKDQAMQQSETQAALEAFERAGSEDGAIRARQAFVLMF